jgi:hypothetical protein
VFPKVPAAEHEEDCAVALWDQWRQGHVPELEHRSGEDRRWCHTQPLPERNSRGAAEHDVISGLTVVAAQLAIGLGNDALPLQVVRAWSTVVICKDAEATRVFTSSKYTFPVGHMYHM